MGMGEVRKLLGGRGLVESPRWHGDRLYFSDWSAGEVVAVGLDGASEVVARVASLPLCTAWLPEDRLVIVSSAEGRLLRREPGGALVIQAHLRRPGGHDVEGHRRRDDCHHGARFNPQAINPLEPRGGGLAAADGAV